MLIFFFNWNWDIGRLWFNYDQSSTPPVASPAAIIYVSFLTLGPCGPGGPGGPGRPGVPWNARLFVEWDNSTISIDKTKQVEQLKHKNSYFSHIFSSSKYFIWGWIFEMKYDAYMLKTCYI